MYFLESPNAGSQSDGAQAQRNRVLADNHELGQLALVCHSWAHMCQKKMFHIISLRSDGDFRALLSLASNSSSRIAEYVVRLELVADNGAAPWIHNVCMKIRPRSESPARPGSPFPNYEGHNLNVIGPSALDVLRRGPHASVPRRPLPAFSRNIVLLVLDGMQLALGGLGDVIHLGRELPSLEALWCVEVTWAVGPSAETDALLPYLDRRQRRNHVPPKSVQFIRTAEAWAVLPLIYLMDSACPLHVDDISAVAKLARTLTISVELATGHPKQVAEVSREDDGSSSAYC